MEGRDLGRDPLSSWPGCVALPPPCATVSWEALLCPRLSYPQRFFHMLFGSLASGAPRTACLLLQDLYLASSPLPGVRNGLAGTMQQKTSGWTARALTSPCKDFRDASGGRDPSCAGLGWLGLLDPSLDRIRWSGGQKARDALLPALPCPALGDLWVGGCLGRGLPSKLSFMLPKHGNCLQTWPELPGQTV